MGDALKICGSANTRLGKLKKGRAMLTDALKLALEHNHPLGVAQSSEALAAIAAQWGHTRKLEEHLTRAIESYESLGNRQKAQNLREMYKPG